MRAGDEQVAEGREAGHAAAARRSSTSRRHRSAAGSASSRTSGAARIDGAEITRRAEALKSGEAIAPAAEAAPVAESRPVPKPRRRRAALALEPTTPEPEPSAAPSAAPELEPLDAAFAPTRAGGGRAAASRARARELTFESLDLARAAPSRRARAGRRAGRRADEPVAAFEPSTSPPHRELAPAPKPSRARGTVAEEPDVVIGTVTHRAPRSSRSTSARPSSTSQAHGPRDGAHRGRSAWCR